MKLIYVISVLLLTGHCWEVSLLGGHQFGAIVSFPVVCVSARHKRAVVVTEFVVSIISVAVAS